MTLLKQKRTSGGDESTCIHLSTYMYVYMLLFYFTTYRKLKANYTIPSKKFRWCVALLRKRVSISTVEITIKVNM